MTPSGSTFLLLLVNNIGGYLKNIIDTTEIDADTQAHLTVLPRDLGIAGIFSA